MPLPWFRRRKPAEEQRIDDAAVRTETAVARPASVEAGAQTDSEPEPDSDSGAATRPKRRRGSRGGRRRKKSTPAAGGDAQADADGKKEKEKEKEKAGKPERGGSERKDGSRRSGRREGAPRRRAPRRAPLPKARRELLVSVDAGEKRVAVLEDDKVAEVYLERPERRSIAGNIYKGVVDNVLPGMEAAFVEIGLEKNGFLYVDEIVAPELEGRRGARKIQDLIQKGQEIVVQAVKDPMKTKGARLTTEVSLPGRFVVYQPYGEGLGVSRRLEDDERNRLKGILKEIAPARGGVIVRTAAEGASEEDVQRDLEFLERLWKSIESSAGKAKAPSLVYQEAELPLRVTRDLFTGDFEKAYVDHDRTYKRIVGYLKKTSPHMVERVVRYKEKEPLMVAFGVDAEIRSTLNKRVDLPSGGYLIFDYAEAFTVVDVNTGRFVGGRGRNANARLEDTITKNNLEAVKEVVRQLRLRDIGGIIVIDFIDMANPKNRQTVEEALRTELERDRTKTYVVEISPLGLVEMTRQNVTDGPREVMTRKCPTCGGDGIVVSEQTAAVEVERRLRGLVTPGSRTQAFRVEVNARIASLLIGPGASRLAEIEELTRRTFFVVGKEDVHLDHFAVLEQGTLAKLKPESGLEAGQTVSLKLGEVDRYDPNAAVGKLEDMLVVVAGAAKLVGKTVKVEVGRSLDGVAYGTLVTPVAEAVAPITAEAEAEKPTRARRAAAKKAQAPPEEKSAAEDEDEEGDAAAGEAAETEPAEATPRKKSRRGSRGGRRHRKKPVEAAGTEPEPGDGAGEEAPAGEAEPRIHVPSAELGRNGDEEAGTATAAGGAETESESESETETETDEAPPKRKKTRRGSRGGRRRKKKPAETTTASSNGSEPDGTAPAEQPEEPEAAPAGDAAEERGGEPEEPGAGPAEDGGGDWEYVPMSEWEDDVFRSRG